VENGTGSRTSTRKAGPTVPARSGVRGRTTTITTGSHVHFPNDKMTGRGGHGSPAALPPCPTAVSSPTSSRGRVRATSVRTGEAPRLPGVAHRRAARQSPRYMAHDPVDYYVYVRTRRPSRRPPLHVTPDMIDVYSRLTGRRLSVGQVCANERSRFFGGMENVSATTLVDWLPGLARLPGPPWYRGS